MSAARYTTNRLIGPSRGRGRIRSDLRPFKDILLGLFFVTLGMGLDIGMLIQYWPRLLLFTLVLVVLKVGVVALVVNLMGNSKRNALRAGITLAQAWEFGLALIALANREGIVPDEQASFIMILALLSMVASSILIRKNAVVTSMFHNHSSSGGALRR